MRKIFLLLPLAAAALGSAAVIAAPAPQPMTFFVTSNGPGKGGDLGGLAGADAHCQTLAAAAGAGNRTWRAYLSTQGQNAVNARDRIGKGPWHNAKGVEVGKNPDAIHGMTHPFNMDRIVTEEGCLIPNGMLRAQPARHPDRLDSGRQSLSGGPGHDLRQLDEQHHGKSQGRSS